MSDRLWVPSAERLEQSNLKRFIGFVNQRQQLSLSDHHDIYQFSITKPEAFWVAVWEFCGIHASGTMSPVLENPTLMPGARWFPGMRLNFAENLLRHRNQRTAIWFRGEDGRSDKISYEALAGKVASLAQHLAALGVGVGDKVAGYVANLPETLIAMLATTSLGAVWSSCSPDFGIAGVLDRFTQIQPKVLIAVDGYHYGGKAHSNLDKIAQVVAGLPTVVQTIVIGYLSDSPDLCAIENSIVFADTQQATHAAPTFTDVPFAHPLYILYSSGTTGVPKCIVHSVGGTLLQHLKELQLHTDLKREDKIFYYTTCGWMMWNWLVSALAVGATVVLYDGSPSYPDGNRLWDLADEAGVSVFGTSAKWISATEKAGVVPAKTHKLLALKTILSTGSPLAPESYDYVYRNVKADVLLASISGGTDIVSCFALGSPMLPVYRGELQCRGLGMKVQVLDDNGQPVVGEKGELSCVAPFPAMPIGFAADPDGSRYRAAYFERVPGVWCHGDHAMLTSRGGVIIYGRSDATLNPGGVRIGTAEIYRQVETLPSVVEALAVGQRWGDDERVVLFVRLQSGAELDEALVQEIRQRIRANTTPRHVPAKVIAVADFPRTRSGKLTELAVRQVIHGETVRNTDALANPDALALFANLAALQH